MEHAYDSPNLGPETIRQFIKGVDQFNSGLFFECHDTLEDIWHGVRGPSRDFFQGLIHIAVGFYHLDKLNLEGSRSQLEKGLRKLIPYGDRFLDVDLQSLRSQAKWWLDRIIAGRKIQDDVMDSPKIHLLSR